MVKNKIMYYLYHNWQAGQKNKIHKGECGHCKQGKGKRGVQTLGKNGVWIGPFATLGLAKEYVAEKMGGVNIDECNCCKKKTVFRSRNGV